MRVGIIGGGVAGLAAAYHLTKEGHFAEVFEVAPFLGGQASTFDVFGGRLERAGQQQKGAHTGLLPWGVGGDRNATLGSGR